ncbi:MAG TPA: HAD family hydrolase [Spirochaetota bacterium]|nr:HAD family hydrolase [Spirochaetota bacterium]HOR44911.1 HAD family hydrolase [Spirochaetota bacterium]HPK56466.1 HAD family hydrolase [Spirochaetota bacterium]
MIKTVFFDLGNTIVDYHSGNLTDEEKDFLGLFQMHGKLKEYEIGIEFDKLLNTFYYPWINVLTKRNESKKEFDMMHFMPDAIQENSNIFMELILAFHEPCARFAVAMHGIREVLSEIKSRGIKTGIISNSTVPGQCHSVTLKYLNLSELIDYEFYSYDIGIRKPSHEIFRTALIKSGSMENESLMVGDRLEMDIMPAQEIGMQALWFSQNSLGSNDSCAFRIKEFDEILLIL